MKRQLAGVLLVGLVSCANPKASARNAGSGVCRDACNEAHRRCQAKANSTGAGTNNSVGGFVSELEHTESQKACDLGLTECNQKCG
jgi:hypothetical protein